MELQAASATSGWSPADGQLVANGTAACIIMSHHDSCVPGCAFRLLPKVNSEAEYLFLLLDASGIRCLRSPSTRQSSLLSGESPKHQKAHTDYLIGNSEKRCAVSTSDLGLGSKNLGDLKQVMLVRQVATLSL